jgi:hypothetical protein
MFSGFKCSKYILLRGKIGNYIAFMRLTSMHYANKFFASYPVTLFIQIELFSPLSLCVFILQITEEGIRDWFKGLISFLESEKALENFEAASS